MRQVLSTAFAALLFAQIPVSRVIGPFPGQLAPAFSLPTISGGSVSLAELLASHRPVVLHFSGPG